MNKRGAKAISERIFGERITVELGNAYRWWNSFFFTLDEAGHSQSDESDLVDRFTSNPRFTKTYCEFGFDIAEFNCARLALGGWRGLLIDGDKRRVRFARRVIERDRRLHTVVRSAFLTLDNVRSIVASNGPIGVLSIDVDGNDFWFLQALIVDKPILVVIEYNASFGLRSITVPYDPKFDRHTKHSSGWYHGAGIVALTKLSRANGYDLVAVSESGGNLFFLREDFISDEVARLDPAEAYRENKLTNEWSKSRAEYQWSCICSLDFVEI